MDFSPTAPDSTTSSESSAASDVTLMEVPLDSQASTSGATPSAEIAASALKDSFKAPSETLPKANPAATSAAASTSFFEAFCIPVAPPKATASTSFFEAFSIPVATSTAASKSFLEAISLDLPKATSTAASKSFLEAISLDLPKATSAAASKSFLEAISLDLPEATPAGTSEAAMKASLATSSAASASTSARSGMLPTLPKPSRKSMETTVEQLFDDVFDRIRPTSWRAFHMVLMRSKLHRRRDEWLPKLTVRQVYTYLEDLSRESLPVKELVSLELLCCILYLIPFDDPVLREYNRQKSRVLARNTGRLAPTLEPMMVHYMTSRMVEHFAPTAAGPSMPALVGRTNIIQLSRMLGSDSGLARPVSVCMLWCVIYGIAKLQPQLHEFRDLNELYPLLLRIKVMELCTGRLDQLCAAVALLLHRQLCCKEIDEYARAGYMPFFFRILPLEVEKLKRWFHNAVVWHDRPGFATNRLMASLNYLEKNKAEWCLTCRAPKTEIGDVAGQVAGVGVGVGVGVAGGVGGDGGMGGGLIKSNCVLGSILK